MTEEQRQWEREQKGFANICIVQLANIYPQLGRSDSMMFIEDALNWWERRFPRPADPPQEFVLGKDMPPAYEPQVIPEKPDPPVVKESLTTEPVLAQARLLKTSKCFAGCENCLHIHEHPHVDYPTVETGTCANHGCKPVPKSQEQPKADQRRFLVEFTSAQPSGLLQSLAANCGGADWNSRELPPMPTLEELRVAFYEACAQASITDGVFKSGVAAILRRCGLEPKE